MAWHNKGRDPMANCAFSSKKFGSICNSLSKLAHRQFDLAKKPFSGDELAQLFVPTDQRKTLQDAYRIANPSGYSHDLYVTLVLAEPLGGETQGTLNFSWDRTEGGFFVPNGNGSKQMQPCKLIQPDCPTELIDRFLDSFGNLIDISYRFGLCNWVFEQINKVCRTPAQLRYYWPAVVPLMKMASLDDEAQEIAEPSARAGSSINITDHPFAEYLRETNNIVARAQMIDKIAPQTRPIRCSIMRQPFMGGKFHNLV